MLSVLCVVFFYESHSVHSFNLLQIFQMISEISASRFDTSVGKRNCKTFRDLNDLFSSTYVRAILRSASMVEKSFT
jgi:hypothetical protein